MNLLFQVHWGKPNGKLLAAKSSLEFEMLNERKQGIFSRLLQKEYEVSCDKCGKQIEDSGAYVLSVQGVPTVINLTSSSHYKYFCTCRSCLGKPINHLDITDLSEFTLDCCMCKKKLEPSLKNFNKNIGIICETCFIQNGNPRNKHKFGRKPRKYCQCTNCGAVEVKVDDKYSYWELGSKSPKPQPNTKCENKKKNCWIDGKCDYVMLESYKKTGTFTKEKLELVNRGEMYPLDADIVNKGFFLNWCVNCGNISKEIIW